MVSHKFLAILLKLLLRVGVSWILLQENELRSFHFVSTPQSLRRKIAETVGVSLGSVSSILKQKRETGNVEVQRKGRCGNQRKTTKRYDLTLLRKSKLNPRKTSEELKRDMDDSGVHVSSSTVRRRLLEKGRKARRPKKKQLLTAAMKQIKDLMQKVGLSQAFLKLSKPNRSHRLRMQKKVIALSMV